MPLKLNSSGGGSVTLDVPVTASAFNVIVPANAGTVVTTGSTAAVTQGMLASGVAGNGPAFSAFRSTNQTVTPSTFTKIQLSSEEFDTNNNYDAVTNYRFTPTVAGYYQINGAVPSGTNNSTICLVSIFKNGSEFKRGNQLNMGSSGNFNNFQVLISSVLYLNGTTDYVELYVFTDASVVVGGQSVCYFQAFLARAA